MKNKVSVIIPVYNAEKFLPKSLDSVINQTYKNLEIICINDGSEDSSSEIIQSYKKNDNRIKAIEHENNKGLSGARNTGINAASGDYIYFLDSDDYIDSDYIEKMVQNISTTDSDIVMNRNVVTVDENNNIIDNTLQGQKKFKDDSYINIKEQTHDVFCSVWSKIYNRKFLLENNLIFPEGYIYEDMYYHYITFVYAKKVYFFKGSKYYYRRRNYTISQKMNKDSDKIIKVFELIYDFYREHNLLNTGIKIYYTMPNFNIQNEETYNAFKTYFKKTGEYILSNYLYNDMDKFFCSNIMNTENYSDYIKIFPANVGMSYIRRTK